ncbi:MAG: hypothetical protein MZV64_17475 [Ignavibacteriales bacterium]|nr:hypothetical protein [Ignavibacteriales bacterium]
MQKGIMDIYIIYAGRGDEDYILPVNGLDLFKCQNNAHVLHDQVKKGRTGWCSLSSIAGREEMEKRFTNTTRELARTNKLITTLSVQAALLSQVRQAQKLGF